MFSTLSRTIVNRGRVRLCKQPRKISSYTDKFNNSIYSFDGDRHVDINSLVGGTPIGKGILLKGIDRLSVQNYNETVQRGSSLYSEMMTAEFQCDPNVYLIRNWSKCPELVAGKFVAAGVNIIVEHDGLFYSVLMKDKTRKYLTCPGGTGTMSDVIYNNNSINFGKTSRTIAVRELLEETESSQFPGITLDGSSLDKLCEFKFRSKFFDINGVRDTYSMYSVFVSLDNRDKSIPDNVYSYFDRLFDKANLRDESCYKLSYSDHEETEFVYAWRLIHADVMDFYDQLSINNRVQIPGGVIFSYMHENRAIMRNHFHPVTYLHATMSQYHLFTLLNRVPMTDCHFFTLFNRVTVRGTILMDGFSGRMPDNLDSVELFISQKE